MVSRVSTVGNYSAIIANLMAAQARQVEAGNQVATQKVGKDLKDYAKDAEVLTAMRSIQTRLEVYQSQNSLIADRLDTQDTALNQVADAAQQARQAIADALATDRADTLMEDLGAQLRNAVEGMNARYGGKYLFAGGQIDTRPVTVSAMSDLTAPATTIPGFFQNDDFKAQTKVDDAVTITTGILAVDIGTDMLTAFRDMQAFEEGGTGSFGGQLTPAQRTFLESQLAVWDGIRQDVTTMAGRNGLNQKRVETSKVDLESRADTLTVMMGEITDVDMPEAISRLEAAQLAVQAAAQVFAALQSTSLLNVLK